MSSAQAGAGKSAVGPLRHDRPAAGASASSRGVKAEAGIALGVGGGQSGGGSGTVRPDHRGRDRLIVKGMH